MLTSAAGHTVTLTHQLPLPLNIIASGRIKQCGRRHQGGTGAAESQTPAARRPLPGPSCARRHARQRQARWHAAAPHFAWWRLWWSPIICMHAAVVRQRLSHAQRRRAPRRAGLHACLRARYCTAPHRACPPLTSSHAHGLLAPPVRRQQHAVGRREAAAPRAAASKGRSCSCRPVQGLREPFEPRGDAAGRKHGCPASCADSFGWPVSTAKRPACHSRACRNVRGP